MVESSRIDHSGHENCVQAHAQEALEYDQVINLVHNYTKNADVDTVVVATADHETGGLVLNQKHQMISKLFLMLLILVST